MTHWCYRAALAVLVAVFPGGAFAALEAQQASPASAPASSTEPTGPRVAPVIQPVEPTLEARQESRYAPVRRKDTTVITISTLGLILILVVIILLVA